MNPKTLSRRTLLRSAGITLALPWLEAMPAVSSWAEGAKSRSIAPNRMAFLYVPNGVHMPAWTPKEVGANYTLSPTLEPLAKWQSKLLVLSGLTSDPARDHGDGAGGHARALSAYLTGVHPYKTDGANLRNGASVDQVAASYIGNKTRLSSIELGCEQGAMAGSCDSGYSCVYSSTMSWRSPTQPLPKEVNPKLVFERLFGASNDPARIRRDSLRKSVLDYVLEDSKSLVKQLGSNDVRKLDEYFTSVREVELRIERAEKIPLKGKPTLAAPTEVPANYQEYVRLMCDLMVLAFQMDCTRVATFVFSNEGSNMPYAFINVPDGHHDLSHHGGDPVKHEKLRRINTFHIQQYAYLLSKLDAIQEGDGTLLDHSMIAYGSGIHDGNAHNYEDLPVLVGGKGCGTLSTGRHLRYEAETPLSNLWASMLRRVDVVVDKFGDSTGALPNLL